MPPGRPAWSALRHAYGAATDVPALLNQVADRPDSEEPWHQLWSALCHQDDVYPASFAAVPAIVATAAEAPGRARFDLFLFPASVELARVRKGVPIPDDLRAEYFAAMARLPFVAAAAASRPWDPALGRSILAAIAVSKQQYDTAELLIEIDDGDEPEVLAWYQSR
jgi:hypothetical protein